jgi:hypothetical protein
MGLNLSLSLTNCYTLRVGFYVGKGYINNWLLKINVMIVFPIINNNTTSTYMLELSNLWHGRLGHVIIKECIN